MPSLTTVTLSKAHAFNYKKTVHTKSPSSSSPPLSLDITPALSDYLSFPPFFTHLSSTPDHALETAFSTRVWQAAQLIPVTVYCSISVVPFYLHIPILGIRK